MSMLHWSAVVSVGTAVVLSACTPTVRDAQIIEARLSDEGRELLMSVGACNAASNTAEVEESADAVTVLVTTTAPAEGDGCADGVRVDLAEPLGGRTLVDASTGETVEISP